MIGQFQLELEWLMKVAKESKNRAAAKHPAVF
jgi:hypothetical protein